MTAAGDPAQTAAVKTLTRAGRHRKAGRGFTEEQLAAEWRSVDTLRQRALGRLQARIEEYIAARLHAAAQALAQRAQKSTLEVVSDIIDLAQWLDTLTDLLSVELINAIREGFETGKLRIDSTSILFDAENPEVRRVMNELIQKAQSVPETLRDAVADAVGDGLEGEETWDEIAARVNGLAQDMPRWKAEQIAQTTGTGAFEQGQLQAFKAAGVDAKRWLSQRDGRVRPSHFAADGEEVGLDDPFTVGGAPMQYPGDPTAPAREVVNCRCSLLPIIT